MSLKKYINQKKMLLIEQLIPTGFSIRRLTKNILITITPLFSSNISNMQKNRRAVTKTNLTPQNKAIKAEPDSIYSRIGFCFYFLMRTFLNIGSNFGNIVKPFVFQNLFFRKVTMVVENRHILCVSFVKFYRRFVFKKKIIL